MNNIFKILPDTDPREYSFDTIAGIIASVTDLAFLLFGIAAFAMLLWGGFEYISSFGDESKAQSAKKTLTWTIVGVIVIIIAKVLINFVLEVFGAQV